jgi:hypothetical protein
MTIHAFVVVSNHAHFLLSPTSAYQLARLMQFVNANIAKEVARLQDWPERVWSRRYRAIPVVDDKAAHARIRYQMSHGAKEGLVAAAGDWPGPNCIAVLTHGDLLRGTWHDRSGEYRARAAGKEVKPGEFTTSCDVKLTPLPCILDLTEDQHQAHYRRVVREIDLMGTLGGFPDPPAVRLRRAKPACANATAAAYAANKEKGRTPLGVEKILAQDPHHRPKAPDRSPAPRVHAYDEERRDEYLHAYRVFVSNFRAGVDGMLAKAKLITDLFPDWAFPPALPFKVAAAQAA